jgi:hypothetical protein
VWEKIFSILGGNLFTGVAEVIKTFIPDPTERAKAELALHTLQIQAQRDLIALEAADRDSARKREMTVGGYTMPILTGLYTVGYFGMMIGLMTHYLVIPADQGGLFQGLVGVLTAGQYAIMSYYYGSSAGSAAKTQIEVRK